MTRGAVIAQLGIRALTEWPFPITLALYVLSLLVGSFVLFVKRQNCSKDSVSSAGIALIVLGAALLRFCGGNTEGVVTFAGGSAGSLDVQVIAVAVIFVAGLATAPWWLGSRGLASAIVWSVVTLAGALFYLGGLALLHSADVFGAPPRPTAAETALLSSGSENAVLIFAVVSAIVFLCGVAMVQRWHMWRLLAAVSGWALVALSGLAAVGMLAGMVEGGNTPADPMFFVAILAQYIASLLYMCGVGVFVLWARQRERTVSSSMATE
jgi:hypothetical protein